MKYLKIVILIIFLLSTIFVSSSAAEEEIEVVIAGVFIVNQHSQFTINNRNDLVWLSAISAGLYERDSDFGYSYVPELANGAPILSDDLLIYTVILKDNLKFSDGTPLTAEDVKATYTALLSPNINKISYSHYVNVFNNNHSITVIDALTIEFVFDKPGIFWLKDLSAPIQPKALFDEKLASNDHNFDSSFSDAISAGPYKYESYE